MPTGPIRHHEIVGSFDSDGFRATRDRRPFRPKPPPSRDALRKVSRTMADATSKAIAVAGTFDRMGDSLDRLAAGLRTLADRRRAMQDAVAAPSFSTSATAGYVRDADGAAVRPMTPADLSDAADRHYRRGRYAGPQGTPVADRAAPEPPRRATTAAEMQAINERHWGRAG